MTIKTTAKIIIATAIVAVLLALFFIKNMAQDAVESVPAPFGLEWGMTCKEILALSGTRPFGVGCTLSELSQGLQGYIYTPGFDSTGGLISVYAIKQHAEYPYVEAEMIKRSLITKYGPGSGSESEKSTKWVWDFADGSSILFLVGKREEGAVSGFIYKTSPAHALTTLEEKL